MNRINEPWIKEMLEKHGCELIDYVSECQVLWKKSGRNLTCMGLLENTLMEE